ncbi:FAM207/SLX9 family protein [Aspergillus candidus]|uniref:Ribosome biogenesis protein SLX9 n=1 Tax=Aspergillus candidus TaxID=41067 RepID=A0A2I2FLQ4_ASPCN|nr:ribosome biogenesis protein SLX9-domain-containing protein [Aspergillus candidus]PLB41552.1 ribosome biogenesis protein SLX9-domain-containing protein [Aspergillus candidus]
MAPVSSLKKKQSKVSSAGKGALPSTRSTSFDQNDARGSKKDRRAMKHSSFVTKIEKNSQKSSKRRRASNKLAANLESLADALPDTETDLHDPDSQVNIIKQKTLRHKPGAMKRRERLEKLERDRFAKNMAQMSGMQASSSSAPPSSAAPENDSGATSNRWAALRGFISQTMEQQPAFRGNK